MSDIKVIISIPEDEYNIIKKSNAPKTWAEHLIAKGIPLPKGHGDLIDRKDLIENGIRKGFCDWYDEIKYADTIIEADKEQE